MTADIVTELRDAAANCQDELVRYNLNLIAAELEDSLLNLAKFPTAENLQRVVGHHAHGQKMKGNAKCKTSAIAAAAPLTTF